MTGLKIFILVASLACAAPAFASGPPAAPLPDSCPWNYVQPVQFSTPPTRDEIETARKTVPPYILALRARRACLSAALDRLRAAWKDAQQQPNATIEGRVVEIQSNMLRTLYDDGEAFNVAVQQYNATLPPGSSLTEAELDLGGSAEPPPKGTPGNIPAPGLLSLPTRAMWRTHANCPIPHELVLAGAGTAVNFTYDVTETGAATNARITTSTGNPDLDAAVLTCVTTRWRDEPAIQNGVPAYSAGHPARMQFSAN